MPGRGNDAQLACADSHHVPGVELAAAPQLRLAVDGYLPAGDQGLGVRSVRGYTGQLQ